MRWLWTIIKVVNYNLRWEVVWMYFVNKGWMLLCDGDGVIDMWIANYIVGLIICLY